MDIEIITKTNQLISLKDDWQRLEKQSPEVSFYSTYEFNSIWWDVNQDRDDLKLFVIVVRQNGQVVGIAPLLIETKRMYRYFSVRTLTFMGRGDYLDFLVDKTLERPETVIKDIFNRIDLSNNLWDQIHLTHLNQHALMASYLLASKEYNPFLTYLMETPFLEVNEFTSFEEFKKIKITSSTRRMYNRFNKECDHRFVLITDHNQSIFDEIAALHRKEQMFLKEEKSKAGRYSLFSVEKREQFIRQLYQTAGNIWTFAIYIGDKIVCYDSCYLYNQTLFSWNMAYDPDYYDYRLGKIINYEIFKYLIENKLPYRFDFGSGRYPWKFEWASSFNLVYQLYFLSPKCKKLRYINKVKAIKKALKS